MPTAIYGEIVDSKRFELTAECNGNDRQDIQDRLRFCTPLITPDKEGRVFAPLSWVAITQVVHSFPDTDRFTWVPGPILSAWIFEEILRRSCQGDLLGPETARKPMDHQSAGAIAIGMNGRFLLADEPGCGKTQAALMGLTEMAARNRPAFPALVVCPAAVIDPWLEDIEQVYPEWRDMCFAYRGPNRQRLLKTRIDGEKPMLLIMSYETMRIDVGETGRKSDLMDYGAKAVIFDECHKLCNYQTKQSSRARRLAKNIPNVIGASGTPITSNAGNFWPILNGMYPDCYPDRDRYKARYTLDKGQDYGFEIGGLDPVREPEFRMVMQGTMRRVAKSDVMKDLPPKTYQTRWVDIPDKWRAAYNEMEEDMIAHLPDAEHTTALTAMSTLAKMMRLRQLACSACDVETYEEIDTKETSETFGELIEKIKVTPKLPCWKGDALLELMEEWNQGYEPGERTGFRPIIAAAPYRQLITVCGGMAEKRGYSVGYIVGGMSDKQRTETRLAFQANKLDLICVTTGAGGTGLTLTAADAVAFVARPWPYVEALQMEDRAHRRGQYKNVQIIDFETRKSIEARVREKLHDKAGNLAQLLQDPRIAEEFLGGRK